MDASLVVNVADLYLRQFAAVVPSALKEDIRKEMLSHGSTPKNQVELLSVIMGEDEPDSTAPERIYGTFFDHDRRFPTNEEIISHVGAMYPKTVQFATEGEVGKAARWFGFIAGATFIEWGVYTSRREGYGYACVAAEFAKTSASDELIESYIHIGFAQGTLWAIGAYSISELRAHNTA